MVEQKETTEKLRHPKEGNCFPLFIFKKTSANAKKIIIIWKKLTYFSFFQCVNIPKKNCGIHKKETCIPFPKKKCETKMIEKCQTVQRQECGEAVIEKCTSIPQKDCKEVIERRPRLVCPPPPTT